LHRLRSGTHTFYCSFLVRTGKRIYYTRDSAFWTAVMDTGKYYCTSEKFLSPLPGLGVELAIDKRGTIFIATNRGLCGWYKNRLFELLSTIYHRKMLIDSKNRLWLGQFSGGLSCYEINYQNGQPVPKLLIDV